MRMLTDYYENWPSTHERMLIVRVKMRQGTDERMVPTVLGPDLVPPSRALEALKDYERAGYVKNVVPLSRQVRGYMTSGSMSGAAAMMEPAPAHDPNSGVHIIEVNEPGDLAKLQDSLAVDPAIDRVSR